MSQATYEYPAYALQIDTCPSVRDLFLQSFGQRAIKVNSIFSDSTLLRPVLFCRASLFAFQSFCRRVLRPFCDFGWRGFLHCSANVVAWRVRVERDFNSGADPQPSSVKLASVTDGEVSRLWRASDAYC